MSALSIIVPIYNVEAFLPECLDSLLAQTSDDFEVLCVVDGSPDGSLGVARAYAAADGRFRVLEKDNGGLSSARNYGIARARGDYLAFVDADDRVRPEFCARLCEAFASKGADVVVFGANVFPEEEGNEWFDEAFSPEDVLYDGFSPDFMFARYTTPFAWRCAVRRSALAASGVLFDEELAFGEDVVFQFALYPRAGRLAAIPDKLYDYRVGRTGGLMALRADGARYLAAHVDMIGRVFADWERMGLIEQHGERLFDWSIDLLTYGADELAEPDRRAQFARVDGLWARYFRQGTHPMHMETGCLCRGDGKFYVECSADALMPFATLECSAEADGVPVPMGAYPRIAGASGRFQDWVLEMPWLDADSIRVQLRPDGRAYEQAVLEFGYARSKWESRLNYRVRPGACAAIRDFERGRTQGRFQVGVIQRLERADCSVWRVGIDWEGERVEPRLTALDAAGHPMPVEVHVLERRATSRADGSCENHVTASVLQPPPCDCFFLACDDGGESSVVAGFAAVDADAAAFHRHAGEDLMRHAGTDDGTYSRWLAEHRATRGKAGISTDLEGGSPMRFLCVVSPSCGEETAESLRAQTYDRWRMVEADAADLAHAPKLSGQADYVVFLKPGDVLEPDALLEYAIAAARAHDEGEGAGVLYCDEDVRRADGSYAQPLFKSRLNVDLMYCGDWVGSAPAFRSDLLGCMEGADPEGREAFTYDLALRAYEAGARFVYVPKVLCHAAESPFPGAHAEARNRALEGHLERRGVRARVLVRDDGCTQVRYGIARPHPLVSIVVPSKDQCDLLEECVRSIVEKSTYDAYEVVVVENNSADPETPERYAALESEFDRVRVVHWPGEFNYSRIVNFGAAQSRGDYLLFLNNDTRVVEPGFIQEMLGCLQRPDVGVVGAKLLFEDGLVQHAGMAVGPWERVVHVNQNRDAADGGYLDRACLPGQFTAVTGACQMVRRDVFEQVGGYDERFAVGFNDVDFCLRVQGEGLLVTLAPAALLHHREFASRGREVAGEKLVRWRRERALFMQLWPGPFVEGDPYTSPNLKRDNLYYRLDVGTAAGPVPEGGLRRVVARARGVLGAPRRRMAQARRNAERALDKTGNGAGYHEWFTQGHRTPPGELDRQRTACLPPGPKFSVVVPLYKTPIPYLEQMAASVLGQTYGNLELVLVNASPEDGELARAVGQLARADARVVVREMPCNLGITLNTNEGIRAATGDFLCFVDHDDVIEPDALFEYARAVNECPEVDLLYCDEDKLLDGRYLGGFFKPDFDPVLICSANYVTHLLAVRAALVAGLDELPGPEFDGAQDHNLTLLAAERARAVCHVPKVLYHWRIHEGSTADDAGAKTWAAESGRLAVERHLARMGRKATVAHGEDFPFTLDVAYEGAPRTALVVAADDAAALARCLEAVAAAGRRADELVVAWFGDEGVGAQLGGAGGSWAFGLTRAAAVNEAVARVSCPVVMLLGCEAVPASPGWLALPAQLVGCAGAAVCGPAVLHADGTVRSLGTVVSGGVPVRFDEGAPRRQRDMHLLTRFPREMTAPDPACFAVDRAAFMDVGGLDEGLPHELGVLKLAFDLSASGPVVVDPRAEVRIAVPEADRPGKALTAETGALASLARRYPDRFNRPDPHYNPNYAAGSANFELG